MIFVFEGVDGVGKSTLIDKAIGAFKDEDGFDVYLHRHGAPDENGLFLDEPSKLVKLLPFNYYYNTLIKCEVEAIRSFKAGRFPIFFFDRFLFSNLVYGNIFENQPLLTNHETFQLLLKLHKFCWCYVFVTVSDKYVDVIFKRRSNKDEVGSDKDNGLFFLKQLNTLYTKLFHVIKLDTEFALMAKNVTLSNEQSNLFDNDNANDSLINFTKNFYAKMLGSRKQIDKFFLKNYESVGNPNGKIAFVGEKVNLQNNRGYIDPFIGGCGKPFYEVMARFFKKMTFSPFVYVTNAIKTDGSIITEDELKDFEVIIPLGKKAESIIDNLNLKNPTMFCNVYHPQYINRFKHNSFKDYYGEVFEELLVYVNRYQKQLDSQYVEYNLEGGQKDDIFKR